MGENPVSDTFARALADLPPLKAKLKPIWDEPKPVRKPKRKGRTAAACKAKVVARLEGLSALSASERKAQFAWLKARCARCPLACSLSPRGRI
jgi:hypothetical protein